MPSPVSPSNDSDLCPVCTDQSTPVAAISCPGKLEVEVDRPLSNGASKTRTTRVPTCNIPHDIVEMIITLLTRDLGDLKACSLTRRSWYIAAAPHLHHTFTLRGNRPDVTRGKLKPLPELHQLGLIPLVKELRIEQDRHLGGWFAPQAFGHNDLRYFSAFKNVHTLKLERMEIYRFMPTINRYFRYLSPTLRSVTLYKPNCTPRQLSHFLSLFLNLDDIEIERIDTSVPDTTVPDTELFPLSAPRLRGRLALQDFRWAETWIHLIALCGSLRFRHIVLCEKVTCAPTLLEACAGTLETLRFHAMDNAYGKLSCVGYLPIWADSQQELSIYRVSRFSDLYKSRLGWVVTATQTVTASSWRYSRLSHPLCSPSSPLSSRATQ